MSKKKRGRVVQGLGAIPQSTDAQPEQTSNQPSGNAAQPESPPSSPPAKQQAKASRKATKSKKRAAQGSADNQGSTDNQSATSLSGSTKPRNYFARWFSAVNEFWFTPRSPNVLSVIRILTGLLLLYSLAVWTLELSTFFATDGLVPVDYRRVTETGINFAWSYLDLVADSPTGLLVVHCVGMFVVLLFTAGVQTRVTSILAALIAISYSNRSTGVDFGLDQILTFLCLYCAIGNSGGVYSVDRMLAFGKSVPTPPPSARTNIAIRLIQIHLCIVYFFAAIGKLSGDTWWNGEAVWLAMSSYEYQQIDMTWLANYLPLISAMTLLSLFWELLYPALIWPRLSRPIMLAGAVMVHLGIGLCLGMIEFGLVMIVANIAFLERPPVAADQ